MSTNDCPWKCNYSAGTISGCASFHSDEQIVLELHRNKSLYFVLQNARPRLSFLDFHGQFLPLPVCMYAKRLLQQIFKRNRSIRLSRFPWRRKEREHRISFKPEINGCSLNKPRMGAGTLSTERTYHCIEAAVLGPFAHPSSVLSCWTPEVPLFRQEKQLVPDPMMQMGLCFYHFALLPASVLSPSRLSHSSLKRESLYLIPARFVCSVLYLLARAKGGDNGLLPMVTNLTN